MTRNGRERVWGRYGVAAVALAVGAASPMAMGVVYQHEREDRASLELGAEHPMVCGVSMDGCGTLIGPRWVLTAAHVANGVSSLVPSVRFGEVEYQIKAVYAHPEGASNGMRPPRVDLALLELVKPVEGIEPASLLCGAGDEVGAIVSIVGTGDVGIGGGVLRRSDGRLRGVRNALERVGDGRLVVRFDAAPGGVDIEGVGGPGDSGGGMFLVGDGAPMLVGVSSASMGGKPGSFGVQDVYVRVSEHLPWIRRTIDNAPNGGEAIPVSIDVRDGVIPTGTPAAQCLADLLGALTSDEQSAVLEFAQRYRSAQARSERPDAAWAEQIDGLRADFGSFEAERVVVTGDERAEVMLRTQRQGKVRVSVMLDADGKLAGIGIG